MERLFKDFEKVIEKSAEVAIVAHHNPDGDAVGSTVAMCGYLRNLGKNATVILPDNYPFYLDFLDKNGMLKVYDEDDLSIYDTVVFLDLNSISRTGSMADALYQSKAAKILVDHHLQPATEEFDLVISTPKCSSACELLFWVLMNQPNVDNDASRLPHDVLMALATGLITDTNNFCNSVFPSTFKMASAMMEQQINLVDIHRAVSCNYSQDRMHLMGRLLSEYMKVDEDLKIAYILLPAVLQEKYHFKSGDSEGFVNLPLSIKGVRASALFTEKPDMIRVSLRSVGDFSVNELSKEYFNGGGHKNASGGKLLIPFSEVEDYFLKSVRAFVKRHEIC